MPPRPFAGRLPAAATLLLLAVAPLGGCMTSGDGGIGSMFRVASTSATAPASASVAQTAPAPRGSFSAYVESLWPMAQARGVSRATFDEAFSGVTPNERVVELTQHQSEFTRPIWDYLDNALSAERLRLGDAARARHASTLAAVERAYGVPQEIVLGVWGMETNFGSFTGSMDVIRSLATLAHVGHRGTFFRDELLAALEILQKDKIARGDLKGSWAGAMGHTQFMPTSYLRFAVDGDGDGRRDIWNSIPDALASTANYLKQHGWQPGLPWGMEVVLPPGFDLSQRTMAFSGFARAGLRRADGGALPSAGEATLFLPAGLRGPAFLVTANFDVIKRYNASDSYALAVGLLGERMAGRGGVRGTWPRGERMLSGPERREVQERLAALGFYQGNVDGMIGSQTREAVRRFQQARGLAPDGFADVALLETLRRR